MKNFFRSGLKLIGEKKVFQKNYAQADLSMSTDATFQTYAWSKFGPPLSEIVTGTLKNQRIGSKIYIRYITWDVEIYAKDPAKKGTFPYVRIIFAK